MPTRSREREGVSKRRVLDALEGVDLRTLESGLARAYLESIDADAPSLRDRVADVAPAEARSIARAVVGRDAPSLGDILRVFELSVAEGDREGNGVYYTPDPIVEYVVDETVDAGDLVCDPACGGGAFLLAATDRLYRRTDGSVAEIVEDRVYGVDVLADNVRQTKLVLALYAASRGEDPGSVDFNLRAADALRLDWERAFPVLESRGFDAVVGNPPYVRIQDQPAETRAHLLASYETVQEGNVNTYVPFVELSVNLLDADGIAGLVTPLNYFTTLSGRHLREYLQENAYVGKIVDFGELLLFEDARTYTAITFLDRARKSGLEYVRVRDEAAIDSLGAIEPITIDYASLSPEKWRLLDDREYRNVRAIESFRPLDRIADVRAGIATLKDDVYTVRAETTREGHYVARHDGEEYPIEPGICRELVKISAIDDESDLAENDRRIVFPYRKTSTQVSLEMDERRVDHEIVPPAELAEAYPRAYEYLEAVRNVLATRENGAGAGYEPWYRYGRTQGLEFVGERLYTPTYSDGPQFLAHDGEDALFCNGYALFPTGEELEVLERVLNSRVMDYYVRKTSKEIRGNYQCYQKNFIRTFSVPDFDPEERALLRSGRDDVVEEFLIDRYGLDRGEEL